MHDDSQHEINQVNSSLDNMLLRLRQALARVPAGTLQEEVMNTAVQLAVQLAQVLAAIALGNAVLLALIFRVRGNSASLALAAAELLQGRLAVVVLRCNQCHDLILREIGRPFSGSALLSSK